MKAKEINGKQRFYHFDFAKGELKERPIENIATKPYLLSYKDRNGMYDHSLDEILKKVEGNASTAFEELNRLYENISKSRLGQVSISDEVINSIIELLVWQIVVHPDLIAETEQSCKAVFDEDSSTYSGPKQMALDVVENIIDGKLNIMAELLKKNKTIICTSSETAHFITSDKPSVRFNKFRSSDIRNGDTEIYYPLTSNMLLHMCGDRDGKKIILNNDRALIRKLNTHLAKRATKYLIGKNDRYLKRIHKNIISDQDRFR